MLPPLPRHVSLVQGTGKSTIAPIKALQLRPAKKEDGSAYVTIGESRVAVRFILESDIANRSVFEGVIRGVLPPQAGPKVRVRLVCAACSCAVQARFASPV